MPQFPQLYKGIITVLTPLGYGEDQMKYRIQTPYTVPGTC